MRFGVGKRVGTGLWMGLGLGLVGIAGYVLVALAGHTLPPAGVATVTSAYLLLNIIGPGLYVALEQETSRAVAARQETGEVAPTVRNAGKVGVALVAGTAVVLLASSPLLVPKVLGGHWALLGALIFSTVSAGGIFLLRGVVGGQRSFGTYALTLGLEGGTRLVLCVLIAVLGIATAAGYGFAFAAGYALAFLAVLPWAARGLGGGQSGERVKTLLSGVGLLGVATLLSFAVANIAPVVVTARLPDQPVVAAGFAQAFVLARAPTLVFAPVQAMLLPGLTAAAERGDVATLRTRVRQILLAVGAVGVPGAVVAALLGQWLLRVFFGVAHPPSALVLGLLGLSTVLLMIAQTLQPALVAVRRHHFVTFAWVAGTVLLLGLLALPIDVVRAALIAQLVGTTVVAAGCVIGVVSELRRRTRAAVGL